MLEEESPAERLSCFKDSLRIVKDDKSNIQKSLYDSICSSVGDEMRRSLFVACEKGSSIWLTSLPIKKLGFALNQQEFHDAIAQR